MATTRKTVSFRCDRAFFDRMVEASSNVQLSLSEWMRRALEETVKLQLPGAVLSGWKEAILEDDYSGAFFAGNTSKLPENLIGETVEFLSGQGDMFAGVIDEVRFRSSRMVIVKLSRRVKRGQGAVEVQPTAA